MFINQSLNLVLGMHIQFWAKQADEPADKDLAQMDRLYQTAIEYLEQYPGLLQVGGHLSEWQALQC